MGQCNTGLRGPRSWTAHDLHRQERPENAITVRNLPPEVDRAVKEKARKEKLSLHKAVARLLEEATGAAKGKKKSVQHDLDRARWYHFRGHVWLWERTPCASSTT
jgi:hypothetical protein